MSNGTGGAASAPGGAAAEGTGIVDQSSQIGDMLSGYTPAEGEGGGVKKEEEEKTGGKEEKVAPKEEEPTPKEGEVEEDTTVLIKSLSATVKALTDKISSMEAGKPLGKEEAVKEESEKPTIFIKDKAEYDSMFEKPELLNEILNKVASAGGEKVIKALPKIIRAVVKQQIEMQTETAKFFSGNKDLLPHRQFASFVANDIIGQNPNWTLNKLYAELGGEVRKRLGLKAGAAAVAEKKGTGSSAFPGTKGTGARQAAGKQGQLSPLEAEIKDLIE